MFFNNGLYGQIRAQAYPGGRTNTFMNNVTVYDDEQHVFQKAWDRQVTNIGMHASQVVGPGSANMFINNSIIWYPLLLAGDRSVKSLTEGPAGSSGGMASLTVKHTIFRSGSGNWPLQSGIDGGGNLINDNPDFIDTSGNFKLNCGSPAINSGLNNLYPVSISNNDIDGESRIYSTIIDRGAYEQQATEVIIDPEIIISGNNMVIHINANYPIQNASWNLGDGTTGSGVYIDHNYLSNGTFNICINVLTACGSKDTCFQVNIGSNAIGYPDEVNSIKIYPNPTQDITWITALSSDLPFTGQLFETSGKVVRAWNITSDKTSIDLEKVPAGIYFLRFIKEGRIVKTFKLLKQ
ncbi:MAG: T9SS type A sorting domain-containing protein [Sphingobacteriales bacterium]|nr:MAG: T9SS type A sorting domain-containing protein [Sphingobacteriales bacterium]